MPVSNEDFARHRCILMFDDETVLDAVIALRDEAGLDWWYLVLDREQGGFAAAPFSAVRRVIEEQGDAAFELTLGSLIGLVFTPVEVVVEQDEIELDHLRQGAQATRSGVAVLLHEGEFAGIFPTGGTRAGGLFDSGLVNFAGQYAEIPPEGTLSRRRREAKSKKKKSEGPAKQS